MQGVISPAFRQRAIAELSHGFQRSGASDRVARIAVAVQQRVRLVVAVKALKDLVTTHEVENKK